MSELHLYTAHAGEEILFVLAPVLIYLAIRAIADRRKSGEDEDRDSTKPEP
jgi:hypothetical protein